MKKLTILMGKYPVEAQPVVRRWAFRWQDWYGEASGYNSEKALEKIKALGEITSLYLDDNCEQHLVHFTQDTSTILRPANSERWRIEVAIALARQIDAEILADPPIGWRVVTPDDRKEPV